MPGLPRAPEPYIRFDPDLDLPGILDLVAGEDPHLDRAAGSAASSGTAFTTASGSGSAPADDRARRTASASRSTVSVLLESSSSSSNLEARITDIDMLRDGVTSHMHQSSHLSNSLGARETMSKALAPGNTVFSVTSLAATASTSPRTATLGGGRGGRGGGVLERGRYPSV